MRPAAQSGETKHQEDDFCCVYYKNKHQVQIWWIKPRNKCMMDEEPLLSCSEGDLGSAPGACQIRRVRKIWQWTWH